MKCCSIYGLRVRSNYAIPGAGEVDDCASPDLQITLGRMPSWLTTLPEASNPWYESPYLDELGRPTLVIRELGDGDYFRLLYADGTDFLVDRGGKRLWAQWPKDASLEDTAAYLLGPVFGYILLLRGTHCLHGSAIALGGKAIAMIGPSEAGKSTTAAAFARLGYAVFSDDVIALAEQGDAFLVQPAYPAIRLWPASVTALYGDAESLPPLAPNWDKRYLDLTNDDYRFQRDPLPLAAIYILGTRQDNGSAPFSQAISLNIALMALVANSYPARLIGKRMRAREFEFFRRLISRIPVRHLTPHADVAKLSRLCELIVQDFESHAFSEATPGTGSDPSWYV